MKQHIEFRDATHFTENYSRHFPEGQLAMFIDFFWETNFEELLKKYPDGFSDALFPNTGYTYIINLGSPFIMKVHTEEFRIGSNSDNFLPRHQCIECFHSEGCRIFGIKFKISPILLEKKVNFSEYRTTMNSLSYLIDRKVIKAVREAGNFESRVSVLSDYFSDLVRNHRLPDYLSIVASVLNEFVESKYSASVDDLAESHKISARTLQRYFEQAMSLGTKQTLQILRMRRAVEFISGGGNFNPDDFGYYDQSHFSRHLKKFAEPYALSELRLFPLQED